MVIYGIFGGIGSGKTMAMTYLIMQDYCKGKNIKANYNLNIEEYEKINNDFLNETIENDNTFMPNTSIAIDELHNTLDSRGGMRKKNLKRTHFILQYRHIGKGNMDLYYTTQDEDQVDKRVLRNTEIRAYPEIVLKNNEGRPLVMIIKYLIRIGLKDHIFDEWVELKNIPDLYDTHEILKVDE